MQKIADEVRAAEGAAVDRFMTSRATAAREVKEARSALPIMPEVRPRKAEPYFSSVAERVEADAGEPHRQSAKRARNGALWRAPSASARRSCARRCRGSRRRATGEVKPSIDRSGGEEKQLSNPTQSDQCAGATRRTRRRQRERSGPSKQDARRAGTGASPTFL